MAKYLIEANYTPQGVKGVQSGGGSSRRDAIAQMVEGVGGKLESLYFAFGERDVYVIVDLPDNESAAAVALHASVAAAGDGSSHSSSHARRRPRSPSTIPSRS